ncbi:MAG TPA: PAS domain S-box protein, partial [Clostridia bacterium]|nr:PAS domain S-box protein [Clostridia bacterium]
DFDDLVRMAAQICEAPISLVSLVDKDRQWFKGRYGLDISETPRRISFCAHTILAAPRMLVVPDATQDPRFADNELVTRGPKMRSYAAAPLVSPEGHALGTLCVIDTRPRQFTEAQKEALRVLGRQVLMQLELRRSLAEIKRAAEEKAQEHEIEQTRLEHMVRERTAELHQTEERFRTLAQATFEGILISQNGRIIDCNDQMGGIIGRSREELIGKSVLELHPPEEHELVLRGIRENRETSLELHFKHKDGSWRTAEVHGRPTNELGSLRVSTIRDITEQKAAQAALKLSQERLEGIVGSAMDAIISIDSDHRVVLFNPAAEKLFGIIAQAAMGEHINRFIPERFRAAHVRQVEAFGKTGTTSRRMGALGSLTGLRANGEEFPIEASISQVQVQGQKLFTVILRDVTERKRAEEAIKEREERLSLVVDAAQLGTWDWNITTGKLVWSPLCLNLFGFTPETEISYERFLHALHPDDQQRVDAAVRRSIEEHTDYDVEMRAVWPDGSEHWIASRGRAYFENGRAVRMSGAAVDITERKRAEEQARRWEQVFAAAEFGLAYASAATNQFIAVNPSFARERGYAPEELVRKPLLCVYPPQLHQSMMQKLVEIDRTSHMVYESVHQRKDGSCFPVLMEVTTIRDREGRPVSRVAYALDITELIAAREAQARSREELERQVRERTAQLVEANANLQSFAHSAAHDLRSPLRTISSFSQVTLEECGNQVSPMVRSMLERVLQSSEQMGRLLNDLLEYSKMSQTQLKLEPVSLEAAAKEAMDMLQQDIAAKHAAVTLDLPLRNVLGHSSTVVLIISNLISNAIKFMPEGTQPQIRVWADRTGNIVRLNVQDNGIGIAPENIEKVFGAFERLHGKSAYPGTGLGLTIVRRAAERMQGRAGADSKLGEGSRFWVDLQAV